MELLEKINFYNERIEKQGKEARKNNQEAFSIIKGQVPILLSAPHCVEQIREGKIKYAEKETGAIVQYLAENCKCFAIYKTYNNQDDANYDIENNPYKDAIEDIIEKNNIKLLLDFHGASEKNEFDIELGTGEGKNLQGKKIISQQFKETLQKHNINNIVIDKKFKANSEHTISKTISNRTQIPCMQIEINAKYRATENQKNIEKLLEALMEFIEQIKEGK